MSKINKTVSAVLAGAMTAITCLPAAAMDLRRADDQNVMAYWTFDLGGDKGRTEDRQSFGLMLNAPLTDNVAYGSQQVTSYMNQPAPRAALMELKLGSSGSFDRFSLNGNKIVDADDILYATEEGGGMTVMGFEWYYALFALVGAGVAGYLIYDGFIEDDDDDSAAAGGDGGGGTTGTPLDVVLDPLAGLAP